MFITENELTTTTTTIFIAIWLLLSDYVEPMF
jgi:hypothetical protein